MEEAYVVKTVQSGCVRVHLSNAGILRPVSKVGGVSNYAGQLHGYTSSDPDRVPPGCHAARTIN